ncbi:MAG: ZPR1 zinc finger domain-containing protein [Candidatus Bathyarchaeia archaeon]
MELTLRQTEENVPHFGPMVFFVAECKSCRYRQSDVIQLATQSPTAHRFKVKEERDLKARVVRSNTATIIIPELGVELSPGPNAEAFISNVEGVLERVENTVKTLVAMADSPKTKSKAENFMKKLDMARKCKAPFTLVMKDPLGNSAIAAADSTRVFRRKLSQREQEALGYRISAKPGAVSRG